ncbi:MAG: tRNA (adenosine(37)-N6)-threonylcarbamoyltransferase complex ATPase subunit type 1 TsaE [Prevotella sp.]|nr:tRNA (adenosine(37)-N6)-threonylcarbamoyltransferase complex ATPase subunit type 1 TsaE [Alistipes senegalensis]MCM1358770.1 tRNA (adenosine(37)-N6)-threonylcarbamoyltransferase complex ATPase subunit type 1 TsaE [Prevotella sp.]MCM1473285.1 tRNA (adenosine(37)-N6)-threonylcarbamoyltransferase complex ATPase subunit type 1 TsaE [Muribaculaceae bacterium]
MGMKIITHSPEETIKIAEKIGTQLRAGDMIVYKGGLGAGKTTFTRGIATGLGLGDCVSSPTFALVNEYQGKNITLYHFDMYRIQTEDGLESTGFFDYPFSENIAVIEWSENIIDFLPENTINITINAIGENDREIIIEGGERFC